MRFLGPAADAADEIPKYSQLPSGLLVSAMTADESFDTTLTAMGLSVDLTPGLWAYEYMLSWNVVSAAAASYRLTFDGVSNSDEHWIVRVAGTSGLAVEVNRALNTTYSTSTTSPHTGQIRGTINVTSAGTLGLSMLRAASTSGTLKKSSFLLASKV